MKKQNSIIRRVTLFLVTALILSVCAAPFGVVATVEPTAETVLDAHLAVTMGDVNGDSLVNAKDALEVLQFSVKKIPHLSGGFFSSKGQGSSFVSDLSADGKANAKDALQILKIAVGKQQADASVLEAEAFSSAVYELTHENYIPVQVIGNEEQLEKAGLPLEIANDLKNKSFDECSYIVFSDAFTAQEIPQGVQVALYENNALVRYRYTKGIQQAKQYLLAVAVPKNVGQSLENVYVEPIGEVGWAQPTLYTFEYDLENGGESDSRMFVIRTQKQALAFAQQLKASKLLNQPMEQFLFYRAESGFFNQNQMVVWCNYGIQKDVPSKIALNAVLVEEKTATFMGQGEENNQSVPSNGKMRFRMQLLDVPRKMVTECETFAVTPESIKPATPVEIAFQQKETQKAGYGQGIGSPWFVSNAAYIDSAEALAQHCAKHRIYASLEEQYPQSYFENNALLLFNGKPKASCPVTNTVTGLYRAGDELVVQLLEREPYESDKSYTDDFYNNLCIVEINEKQTNLESIRFTVDYKQELVDEQGNLIALQAHQMFDYLFDLEE